MLRKKYALLELRLYNTFSPPSQVQDTSANESCSLPPHRLSSLVYRAPVQDSCKNESHSFPIPLPPPFLLSLARSTLSRADTRHQYAFYTDLSDFSLIFY